MKAAAITALIALIIATPLFLRKSRTFVAEPLIDHPSDNDRRYDNTDLMN